MAELSDEYIGLAISAEELRGLTDWPEPVINDYATIVTSLQSISQAVKANTPEYMVIGLVAPEGVVTSNKSRQYYDTVGGLLYVNPVVGASTGWVAI